MLDVDWHKTYGLQLLLVHSATGTNNTGWYSRNFSSIGVGSTAYVPYCSVPMGPQDARSWLIYQ